LAVSGDTMLSNYDLHLFNEGSHRHIYRKLGAHLATFDGRAGTYFAVWAPNAYGVSVIGDFNGWNPESHRLRSRASSGVWEGFIEGLGVGTIYKFYINSNVHSYRAQKADPIGFHHETPPRSASIVWNVEDYDWGDDDWMRSRGERQALDRPMAIYEVHLGSWMRVPEDSNRPLDYRELAHRLTEYVVKMGFTHVEFLPVMEHPFGPSWGYQVTGYFAPTSRFGTPQDFMYLVDMLHRSGIGVILDWVPSHFATDAHGLAFFDGTHLYEHADDREGFHPDWKSCIFNYGRNEVKSFLVSSALFWLERYHADGLRVDAVASMLYRDYGREEGDWIPNRYGGRENLEAIGFLKQLNESVYAEFPGVHMIAEESTAWPMVSRPLYLGGLGFGMKWDMGWMNDTLRYFSHEPIHRKFHQDNLTFRMLYAFTENFVLPLSHDEVVHGKRSLLGRMPGYDPDRFANLRLLLGYQYAKSGKKLLFMGGEFGQWNEWYHDESLDWHLLDHAPHQGVQRWVEDLNRVYREEPALHEQDFGWEGFQWIDCSDYDNSVLTFLRRGRAPSELILVVCNFTPVCRSGYRIGIPVGGRWRELMNSSAEIYGGTGIGNFGGVEAEPVSNHGHPQSVVLTLPPLSVLYLKAEDAA